MGLYSRRHAVKRSGLLKGLDVLLIAIALAAIIFGPQHLFSDDVPSVGDARAHIHRISYLSSGLSEGKIPLWDPYWYNGYPFFSTYPPLTYFIGAALASFSTSVIAFKLLTIFALALSSICTYLFAKKILDLDKFLSLAGMLIYETSASLFFSYYPSGAIPINLAWGFGILFFICYIRTVETGKLKYFASSAALLALTTLTHVFAVFMVLVLVAILHMLPRLLRSIKSYKAERLGLYSILLGILVSGFWSLPFLSSVGYMSPLYEAQPEAISNSQPFLALAVIVVVLTLGLPMIRHRFMKNPKWLLCFLSMIICLALGLWDLSFIPLGEFLLSWRFLTIFAPFFITLCFLLIIQKILNYKSVFIACSLIFLIQTPYFATIVGGITPEAESDYLRSAYSEITSMIDGKYRVIVPKEDLLMSSDSLVTFSDRYGISTVTGSFNQGDPNFFLFTVHTEWERNWLLHENSRKNIMHESCAKYLLASPTELKYYTDNLFGLEPIVNNNYGVLFALDETPSYAASVTPILLDIYEPEKLRKERRTDRIVNFFNLLIPQGYKIVFVTPNDVPKSEILENVQYVMTDEKTRASYWKGEGKDVVLLLENIGVGGSEVENGLFHLYGPFFGYSSDLFFYEWGNVSGYLGLDEWNESQKNPNENQWLRINQIGELFWSFVDITYEPLTTTRGDDWIQVSNSSPGFTLIKETWHPNWISDKGKLYRTAQGFILFRGDQAFDRVMISYSSSLVESVGLIVSSIGIGLIIVALIMHKRKYALLKRLK